MIFIGVQKKPGRFLDDASRIVSRFPTLLYINDFQYQEVVTHDIPVMHPLYQFWFVNKVKHPAIPAPKNYHLMSFIQLQGDPSAWKLVTPMIYGYTILAAEGGAHSPGCAISDPRSAPGCCFDSSGMKHPSIGGHFRGKFVKQIKMIHWR